MKNNRHLYNPRNMQKTLNDTAHKAMFNLIIVLVALLVLLFLHTPILYYSVGFGNQALALFTVAVFGFLMYSGYLVFSKINITRILVFIIWVVSLFVSSILVNDIRITEEIDACLRNDGAWDSKRSICIEKE